MQVNYSNNILILNKLWLRFSLVVATMLCFTMTAQAAPKSQLIPYWSKHAASKQVNVSHADWQSILNKYVKTKNGFNHFSYGTVTSADKKKLNAYVSYLQGLNPHQLTRAQQFAYWVNLYNAKTVALVLGKYPVSSIRRIGSPISGPWDKKYLKVNGKSLSLNNIEHGILRPIYKDARIHYVVNCASIGCPNLPKKALTAENYKSQMQQAAKSYINHPRGVQFNKKGELVLSSIFKWYAVDFGSTEKNILKHMQKYAQPALKSKLASYKGGIDYEYNWNLNK